MSTKNVVDTMLAAANSINNEGGLDAYAKIVSQYKTWWTLSMEIQKAI